jgi:hypothetical protein
MSKPHLLLTFLSILLFTFSNSSFAQWSHEFNEGFIPVVVNGDTLSNPWVGGLTAPQWSPIDFDFDGDEDLFAFDRDGSRLLAFERTDQGWKYRPKWVLGWPEMVDWCLLRDFDCDGRPDIFTSHQNGIYVYRNITENPLDPQFSPAATPLLASYDFGAGPDMLPIVCLGIDIPAILDHDGDGDIDIISFTENSSTLYRYHGQVECGLQMECTNRCYGMLSEASENNTLYIGENFNCGFNVMDPREQNRDGLHAGGTLTSLQLDNEGPLDLLIGDVSFPNSMAILMEDAIDGQDSAIFVDSTFPLNTGGIEVLNCQRFPAGYHLDVDGDGVRDLLFSPNTYLETDDDASVHFLKNTGEDLDPVWSYIQNNFIQEDMIDLGRGAYPILTDLDGDGLIDLVIANKETYNGVDDTPTTILLFRNTGNLNQPVFSYTSTVDVSTYGIESAFPALGDIDGDGDIDLILGDELGRIHRFDNTSEIGDWPLFAVTELSISDNSGEAIDVGQFAAPQLIDIDSDGLLDLVVGEKNGTLTLFLNCGDNETFDLCKVVSDAFGDNWGDIHVTNILGINGYSTPALYEDDLGIHVLVANETGTVQSFGFVTSNFETALEESNPEVLANGLGGNGFRAGAAFADLNNDTIVDCILGIQNGGLICYYSADSTTSSIVASDPLNLGTSISIFPNPGNSSLNWSIHSQLSLESIIIEVHNQLGALMYCGSATLNGSIPTDTWSHGVYIISLMNSGTKKGDLLGPPVRWIKLD